MAPGSHRCARTRERLAQRGLVRRRRAETDRRGVVVELTTRSEAVLRKLALCSLAGLAETGRADD